MSYKLFPITLIGVDQNVPKGLVTIERCSDFNVYDPADGKFKALKLIKDPCIPFIPFVGNLARVNIPLSPEFTDGSYNIMFIRDTPAREVHAIHNVFFMRGDWTPLTLFEIASRILDSRAGNHSLRELLAASGK